MRCGDPETYLCTASAMRKKLQNLRSSFGPFSGQRPKFTFVLMNYRQNTGFRKHCFAVRERYGQRFFPEIVGHIGSRVFF